MGGGGQVRGRARVLTKDSDHTSPPPVVRLLSMLAGEVGGDGDERVEQRLPLLHAGEAGPRQGGRSGLARRESPCGLGPRTMVQEAEMPASATATVIGVCCMSSYCSRLRLTVIYSASSARAQTASSDDAQPR